MNRPGLLLLQLGSPAGTSVPEVRRFLREFLMDSRVIDIPWLARFFLVNGVIAPFRAPKSAEAYKAIWTEQGSPLMVFTKDFAEKVKKQLSHRFDVRWAARYGEPRLENVMADWDVKEIYVIPLYPQFATSSSKSAIEHVVAHLPRPDVKLHVLRDFYAEPEFIHSQTSVIRKAAESFRPDHYLLSFHGLPVHHVQQLHPRHCLQKPGCCEKVTDRNRWCYRAQCMATARALMSALELSAEKITVAFQSRLGSRPWIEPFSDQVVDQLARDGVRRLLVSCPSFVADCLETLEEVQIRLREQFIAAGGEDLRLVPALNAEDIWVHDFSQMVTRHNLHWWES